ncbi:hypothetical protein [Algoriphagus sediminis]|uniref:GNAT family N-acetyltransferase n=1 Tax=Algoriphagus sediminis TaxID=3057113 RepID=A0ABT7Y8M4_9BACT|nr:hypothetical protein [Algoriphagus sediminis]MDN3202851.1 hypothetical protein [Algoriphagus sediminis]
MSAQGYQLKKSHESHPKRKYLFEDFISEGDENFLCFEWIKKDNCKVLLSVDIDSENRAISLPHSPFGGVILLEEISSELLDRFLERVIENLQHKGVKNLEIIQAPKPYEPHADLIGYLLHKKGFKVDRILNHQFFVGKKKIKGWLKEKAPKILKKAKNQGLKVNSSSINNFDFLNKIAVWNKSRGYDENLDQTQVIQQVSLFPDWYFEISLYQQERLVGSALAVKLTEDSIYYYKSAIDPDAKIKHGGDILVTQLFKLAAELKVNFIDLGSSDRVTSANHKLIFFKSRFSNDQYNKVTWSKDIL